MCRSSLLTTLPERWWPIFITDDQLKTALVNNLKLASEGNLADYWDEILNEANAAAYQDIIGRLQARGFSQAVILQWDRGAEFQKDIGLYWALVRGGQGADFDQRAIDRLDRRNELATVSFAINGNFQSPGGTTVSPTDAPFNPIGVGQQGTGLDLFSLDPNDPRLGETTRW